MIVFSDPKLLPLMPLLPITPAKGAVMVFVDSLAIMSPLLTLLLKLIGSNNAQIYKEVYNYLSEMYLVAKECFRVVKPGKHCSILIGDTRKHRHYVPISHNVLHIFLNAGFILKEDIIKVQHKTKQTREVWGGSYYDFYKIAHEHLYVFRKPS